MDLLKDSAGLSPALLDRYASAIGRFRSISNASTNGTTTISTTNGAIPAGDQTLSPTSSGSRSITDDELLERLARLATAERGPDAPPICTYTTTSTEHGEVYKASSEYIDWLRRRIPGYGVEGAVSRPAPSSSPGGAGTSKLNRFKPH